MSYRVHVYDRAGEFGSALYPDFAAAVRAVEDRAARFQDKEIRVSNPDRADDNDGLTEAEREAVEEAVARARAPRVKEG